MRLIIRRFFDAAHQLPDSNDLITKACARLHGHTYLVEVEIEGQNSRMGMVVDFKEVKNIIDILDHRFINEIFEQYEKWKGKPTTAENIGLFLLEQINGNFDMQNYVCSGIKIWEGYKGDESSYVQI